MPKGPRGEKRPADAIGAAIKVAKIATGEIENDADPTNDLRDKSAKKGGEARARSLTAEQRAEIARVAAEARWKKT